MSNDYDVIIVGAGGAGLAAAAAATEAGASVLLVEAADRVGGTTRLSSGHIYGCATSVQRAAGIEDDTPEAMFAYYMAINQYRAEAGLVKRLCEQSGPTIEWLIAHGVKFDPDQLYSGGLDEPSVRRSHRPDRSGEGLVEVLYGAASQNGTETALKTRVLELVIADGRVAGIAADGGTVRAATTILTTGGFGANRDMIDSYFPTAAQYGDWVWYSGSDTCKGDGLKLGQSAGGVVAGHDRGLHALTHGWNRDMEPFHPPWLIYVNREGERFMNETLTYGLLSGKVAAQSGGSCFAVLDEATRSTAKPNPAFLGLMPQNWTSERIEEEVAKGRVIKADTAAELASLAGINGATLEATIEQHNRNCEAGEDIQFGKHPATLRPVSTPPFYAAEMKPSIVSATFTGLRIDRDARVLDRTGRPIPGLLAAGETTSGVMGEWYVGGGNAIANAIVYGRIAGTTAAHQAGGDHP